MIVCVCVCDMCSGYVCGGVGTRLLQYLCEGQRIILASVSTFCLMWGWFLFAGSLNANGFQGFGSLLVPSDHRSSGSTEATVQLCIGPEDSHSGLQACAEISLPTEPSHQHCIHLAIESAASVLDIKLNKLSFLIQWQLWCYKCYPEAPDFCPFHTSHLAYLHALTHTFRSLKRALSTSRIYWVVHKRNTLCVCGTSPGPFNSPFNSTLTAQSLTTIYVTCFCIWYCRGDYNLKTT